MRYALVSPENVIDRVQSDAVIDPKTGTKPGWRWLPVVEEFGEPYGDTVEGDTVYRRRQDPATIPPPVPDSVSPRQARLALLAIGRLADVEAALAQADEATRIAWEFSIEVRRKEPVLVALGASLGFSDADLDDLFKAAAAL